MKTAVNLQIEAGLLSAAEQAAARAGQPLADYVEAALRDKIGAPEREFVLFAPTNARDLKVVPEPGETEADAAEAQRIYDELLGLTGR